MSTRRLGGLAEGIAALFLEMNGYTLLTRNYRYRGNEVDIVAETGARIVFVEVKCRTSARRGEPGESVGAEKMRRIVRAARGFLSERALTDRSARFDVVEVRVQRGGLEMSVEHIVGAFGADHRRW